MAEKHFGNITTMAPSNIATVLTMDNPKFATYMVVGSLLILKMFGLILLTIYHRFKNKKSILKLLILGVLATAGITPYLRFFYGPTLVTGNKTLAQERNVNSKSNFMPPKPICPLTANTVFISDEDIKLGGTVGLNEDVERVRRAFLNDLENIPAFLFMSLLYLWVSVPSWVVYLLYYLFLLVRVSHSLVYAVFVIPQPARALCFLIGLLITSYLSFHVLIYALVVGYGGK